MARSHALVSGAFASVLLALGAGSVSADVPSPDGRPNWRSPYVPLPPYLPDPPNPPEPTPEPTPELLLPPLDPSGLGPPSSTVPPPPPTPAPQPAPQPSPPPSAPPRKPDPPQRTGPFRSCGSGAGLGLAGIGLAWGMLWLGNRFAGRVARGPKRDRTG